MNTRICKGCGWESPITATHTCFICHRAFSVGLCRSCGKLSEKLDNVQFKCPECLTEHNRYYYYLRDRKRDNVIKTFEDWIKQFKDIPKPYRTLTEQEWLATCRYFKGCAFCGAESIDARGYFIPFEKGGQYCVWNIVPLCEGCATAQIRQPNPWIRFNPHMNARTVINRNLSVDNLQRIVEYLQNKLEEAKCPKVE